MCIIEAKCNASTLYPQLNIILSFLHSRSRRRLTLVIPTYVDANIRLCDDANGPRTRQLDDTVLTPRRAVLAQGVRMPMSVSNVRSPSVALSAGSGLSDAGHAVAATDNGNGSGWIGRSHFFIKGSHPVGRCAIAWPRAVVGCGSEICGSLGVGVVTTRVGDFVGNEDATGQGVEEGINPAARSEESTGDAEEDVW